MRYVPPHRWRIALLLYGTLGMTLGVLVSEAGSLLQAMGVRPGFGMAAVVNLCLPGCMLLITAWYPRRVTAWLGTLLLTLGFIVGALLRRDWHFWNWPASFASNLAHPILLVGMVVDGFIGWGAVYVIESRRRVGVPPDPAACRGCGYSLVGNTTGICPECGHAAPARTDAQDPATPGPGPAPM